MEWSLLVTPRAQRSLDALPASAAAALAELMTNDLLANPRRLGHHLHAQLEGMLSARRGEYRVIYEIDEGRRVVRVLDAGHRRDVYRRGRGR